MIEAQRLKKQLGNRAKDIIASGLGLRENRGKKVLCPLHNDTNPSMSWFEKGLMWRCNACQGQIDIYDYFTNHQGCSFPEAIEEVKGLLGMEVAEIKPIKAEKIKYNLPNIKTKELEQPFIDYMGKRLITKETLKAWKVKQYNWKGTEVYVFPYYDDKGKLVYVSYRGLGKGAIKGGCEPNTMPILWGMDKIDKSKPLVITEGQPDAMVVWQSGYKNVVSVPNGSNNLKWIDNCWDWLEGISEFIVFADNDAPGLEMGNKIKAKLKNVKIITTGDKRASDANDLLYLEGADAVKRLIDDAIKSTPKGILDLAEVEYKTALGIKAEGIETGFYEYDSHVEDWKKEELTIVFGRNGEGKTTFISQVIAHCIERDTKTFLYSGEMSDNKIQNWLYRQVVGGREKYLRTIETKYHNKVEPRPEVIQKIKEWHRGKLYLYDRNIQEITGDLDAFFNIMELASKRYGVQLFVVDNLMAILEENADSLYSDQANFVQRCKNFVIKNKVHMVLLTHPNKVKQELVDDEFGNLEKTDISGSNNIANKADNIIAVERLWGNDRICDAVITSLKDRETGQRKQMQFHFSKKSLRFYNNTTVENMAYGWEMSEQMKKEIPEGFQMVVGEDCPF